MSLSFWWKLSRPRFWIYLLGPALLGTAAAWMSYLTVSWQALVLLVFFTFPANQFLYGVNDVFDYETDRRNPKKQGYEQLLDPVRGKHVLWVSGMFVLPFLVLAAFMSWKVFVSILAFLVLGFFYSAPPVRAKARPFLDALCNILYLLPGVATWYAFGGGSVDPKLILAGALWCMAMHAYSAVPDIEADRAAGLSTIATRLSKSSTLVVCSVLYGLAAYLAAQRFGPFCIVLGIIYIQMMLNSNTTNNTKLMYLYRCFPWLNTAVGFWFFMALLFPIG